MTDFKNRNRQINTRRDVTNFIETKLLNAPIVNIQCTNILKLVL